MCRDPSEKVVPRSVAGKAEWGGPPEANAGEAGIAVAWMARALP